MKFIWTAKAVAKSEQGKADPFHTISAPNIGEVFMGYVRQLKAGTPWILVGDDGRIVDNGVA